jgi:hypothetical protein
MTDFPSYSPMAIHLLKFLASPLALKRQYSDSITKRFWGIDLPEGYCESEAGIRLLFIVGFESIRLDLDDDREDPRVKEVLLRICSILRVLSEYSDKVVFDVLIQEELDDAFSWEAALWRLLREMASECLPKIGDNDWESLGSFEEALIKAGGRRV